MSQIDASTIKLRLEKRFCAPEWATFFEVPDQTGGGNRRADAIAFNLWPSRGLEVNGFEIKVSRSDWLSELKNPKKSWPIQKYCDYWWIVTPPDIVKEGEMPSTWGHMITRGNGLTTVIKAPKLPAEPIGRVFMASVMRSLHETQKPMEPEIAARIKEARDRAKEEADMELKWKVERLERQLQDSKRYIESFKAITGIDISSYSAQRKAELFHLFERLDRDNILKDAKDHIERSKRMVFEMENLLLKAEKENHPEQIS